MKRLVECADLVVPEASDYREIPYYFGMSLCHRVMKRGRWIWPAPDGGEEEEL